MRGALISLFAVCSTAGVAACSPNNPLCVLEITGDAVLARPVGEANVLDTRDGMAMNTPELELLAQVPEAGLGALRRGPCGDVGLAFRRGDELVYVSLGDDSGGSIGTPEVVASLTGIAQSFSLFFDAACSPIVVVYAGATLVMHTREGGAWTSSNLALGDSISPLAALVTGDGTLHVIGRSGFGVDGTLVHGSRAPAAGSPWMLEERPLPGPELLYAFTIDDAGTIHAVYRDTMFPCDPCNLDAFLASLPAGSSTWQRTLLQQGLWGSPHDELLEEASLLVHDARPLVAGHFARRGAPGGSYLSAELRLYGTLTSGICGETSVAVNDMYAGTDGTRFTGASPFITRDPEGRVHVLFLDQSVWHAGGMENAIPGQLRIASRARGLWSVARLTSQAGQTVSPRPLLGYVRPQMVLSADGRRFTVVAVEQSWDTDTIYNLTSPAATMRLVVIFGTFEPA